MSVSAVECDDLRLIEYCTSNLEVQTDFSVLEVTGTLKLRPQESFLFLYQCFKFGSNVVEGRGGACCLFGSAVTL